MKKGKSNSSIGDKIGNTGRVNRTKRNVRFSDSEWKILEDDAVRLGMSNRNELIRYRCFVQHNEKAGRGQISPPADENRVPDEIKIEAIFAIIHLKNFFEKTSNLAGSNELFEEAATEAKQKLQSIGVLD
jgi:hypothetical protein